MSNASSLARVFLYLYLVFLPVFAGKVVDAQCSTLTQCMPDEPIITFRSGSASPFPGSPAVDFISALSPGGPLVQGYINSLVSDFSLPIDFVFPDRLDLYVSGVLAGHYAARSLDVLEAPFYDDLAEVGTLSPHNVAFSWSISRGLSSNGLQRLSPPSYHTTERCRQSLSMPADEPSIVGSPLGDVPIFAATLTRDTYYGSFPTPVRLSFNGQGVLYTTTPPDSVLLSKYSVRGVDPVYVNAVVLGGADIQPPDRYRCLLRFLPLREIATPLFGLGPLENLNALAAGSDGALCPPRYTTVLRGAGVSGCLPDFQLAGVCPRCPDCLPPDEINQCNVPPRIVCNGFLQPQSAGCDDINRCQNLAQCLGQAESACMAIFGRSLRVGAYFFISGPGNWRGVCQGDTDGGNPIMTSGGVSYGPTADVLFSSLDTDGDGVRDSIDNDDDNDGVPDNRDFTPNGSGTLPTGSPSVRIPLGSNGQPDFTAPFDGSGTSGGANAEPTGTFSTPFFNPEVSPRTGPCDPTATNYAQCVGFSGGGTGGSSTSELDPDPFGLDGNLSDYGLTDVTEAELDTLFTEVDVGGLLGEARMALGVAPPSTCPSFILGSAGDGALNGAVIQMTPLCTAADAGLRSFFIAIGGFVGVFLFLRTLKLIG